MDPFSSIASYSPAIRTALRGPYYTPPERALAAAGLSATARSGSANLPFSTANALDYTLCIHSKTATGQPGRDYFPGHASLVIYANDPAGRASNPSMQTLGMWPSQTGDRVDDLLDNLVQRPDVSDVRLNDSHDAPNPSAYPFTYCQPIDSDGYHALIDFAGTAGDYQVFSNSCSSFAAEGFNEATRTSTFGTRGMLSTPSDVGAQILERNGAGFIEPSIRSGVLGTVEGARTGATNWLSNAWSDFTSSVSGAWNSISSFWR